ncbi:peptidase [Longispora fulva]|uniref:Pimeloyl-ACP methyl ester carboxylesterase n=1 Tax=Longispora fulva TaxID=619741 RepID=A0A8J7GIN2_9ACTN|nr:alpha/beta hydrolase [Longispora fulva]MBG6137138.1 pimeloyl-ACP methyl ester carboxylesterase [Longispora fulva]GIG61508.1 peptidase [Longispora fulva]
MLSRKLLIAGVLAAALVAGVAVVAVLAWPRARDGGTIAWAPCEGRDGFECATLRVPLDHARPDGRTIGIALNRLPATGARLGALVVNPGGPGESGLDTVFEGREQFGTLVERYDIVGFDPRGVGASEAVRCLDDRGMDEFTAADLTPATAAERDRTREVVKGFADACAAHSGDLLPFTGTENVARDLELIRAGLGEERLNYFGFSYGTRLGQVYAEQFPGKVGRMVLDSVDNPAESETPGDATGPTPMAGTGLTPAPAAAEPDEAESALRDILRDCVGRADCPVGRDENGAVRAVDDLLANLRIRPLPAAGGRRLTESLARAALFHATYSRDNWEGLREGLRQAVNGTGDGLLALSDAYYHRDEHGHYANSTAAFAAVNCLIGDPRSVPEPPDAIAARMDADAAGSAGTSPHFGAWLFYGTQYCAYWPVRPTVAPHAINAPGTPTILLLNNTRDAATPLSGAEAVAEALEDARLVVADADGHIAYGNGACVDRIVNEFLLTGRAPAKEHSWPAEKVSCPA